MKRIFLLLTFMLSFLQLKADEGMWLLSMIKRLNGVDLKKDGLKLTPDEIYSVNNSSLKDAIVQFGGGCTAEMVSKEGLLFTNHHCGYGNIAALSTPENDHLTNGFWAMKKSEELPSKGLSVRFMVRMDDVSKRINAKLNNNMSAEERNNIINAEYKLIQAENSENGKYTVVVKDFYNGNEFYYFVYQDFKDVRLVGTPPNALGKFGGDTDNWEWPRHTVDFSVFRVYADANGNPAEYSPSNVPMKPKHALPISMRGYKPGDFAMILGYPGRTNRFLTSFGIEQMVSKDYPAWVEASKVAMDVMKIYMDKDQATKLDYASQYASVANYWKNRQGTIDAVIKNGTIAEKQALEQKFQTWALMPENIEMYGSVLQDIKSNYAQMSNRNVERNFSSQLQRNAKYITISYQLGSLLRTYADQDAAGKAAMKTKVTDAIDRLYDGVNIKLEGEMLNSMVNLYQQRVNKEVGSPTLFAADAKNLSTIAFSSIFATKESAMDFVNNPDRLRIDADPLLKLSNGFITDQKLNGEKFAKVDDAFAKNSRIFLDGLRKSQPETMFYPDANSTMRLTTGKVTTLPERADRNYEGIKPKDNYYTDIRGMVAKYKKGDEEFDLPQRFLDLVKKKDFGQYKDKKGFMPVNFLTDNDITGGNSGSPVLDGEGNLLGLAFDGNSEALSGDIIFDKKWQKTINVDIRMVLWTIEKYGQAGHLISELTLVK
ncbi:S46 family peptidase [Kaistella flava (ex Peng et al. 2021)]|uniref:Dipeptidyl-peptidase n=1 Tax=Kaistella flava (ex Peng et al. 2021) TaxID=2038776 RepID=A0A7M2YCJ2_9FLAO|nr:S46 family peptidase [Kaistella flava (ex Peng et al. 2021)]QOW11172.1 S46 family peptidase [Kaistella flava (ex Peng et al. 2021)]